MTQEFGVLRTAFNRVASTGVEERDEQQAEFRMSLTKEREIELPSLATPEATG